jgi:hypothetical protein
MAKTMGLTDFLKSKARHDEQEPLLTRQEWETRKEKWLRRIDELYEEVRNWLEPLKKETILDFIDSKMVLNEPPLDPYNVKVLTIVIGGQRISFVPKGTLIVGAQGRVDIQGHKGMRTIILSGDKWSLVRRTPSLKLLDFDQTSFQSILDDVME